MVFAVVQTCRGHRKTDLFDEKEYYDLVTPYGIIRTAFLSALIRLADEIDVGVDRNSELLFDSSKVHDLKCIEAFATHESILHYDSGRHNQRCLHRFDRDPVASARKRVFTRRRITYGDHN